VGDEVFALEAPIFKHTLHPSLPPSRPPSLSLSLAAPAPPGYTPEEAMRVLKEEAQTLADMSPQVPIACVLYKNL
jgi:hypothetical protein